MSTTTPPQLVAKPVIPTHPKLFAVTIDNVFTPEECSELIKMSEDKGYEAALVNVGFGKQKLMTDIRNNDRCIIDTEELADKIYQRIKQFVPDQMNVDWNKVGCNERLRFLRYFPKQEFKPHYDGSYERTDGPKKGERSYITLQVYLNDVKKGGETTFFVGRDDTFVANPTTGMVILFQHNILHEGSPVLEGAKYVIRTDIMYEHPIVAEKNQQ